jgi:hypothetical protein
MQPHLSSVVWFLRNIAWLGSKFFGADNPPFSYVILNCYSLMSTICMKLDPGMHIDLHLCFHWKNRCDSWSSVVVSKAGWNIGRVDDEGISAARN